MTKIPKEASDNVPRKEEDSSSSAWSSMEQQWLRLKDPRIVRVARSCGGKDRHSKVCTIRGLRDRRVRLSVPTAIQLYDLQERLGFNQPSKVIDWLLNVAKNDIDELPPLPPLNLALLHHHHHHHHHNSQPKEEEEEEEGTFWKLIEPKEASTSHEHHDDVQQGSNHNHVHDHHQLLSHHAVQVVPRHHHHASFVGSNYQWEASGSHHADLQSLNVVPLSLSTGHSSHHHFGANMDDMDHNNNIPRQLNYSNNHYPMLSSVGSNLYPISMAQSFNKPFGLSIMTPNNTTSSDQLSHQSHNHLQNFPTKS